MSFVVIIPARYASTRLPGKPLADIHGKPMVQHVVEKALQSGADRVIVATDDERVQQAHVDPEQRGGPGAVGWGGLHHRPGGRSLALRAGLPSGAALGS